MELENADILMHETINIALRILHPIAPHVTHHLWKELNFGNDILTAGWPKVNAKALICDDVEMIVQINGKRRTSIKVSTNETDEMIKQIATSQENIKPYLTNKEIIRTIIVPKRLINLVVK